MGIETILIAAAVVAGVLIGLMYPDTGDTNEDEMSPATLDSFRITTAKEGQVVPLRYGKVRGNSNIIGYANLTSVEVVEEVEGGKGDSGSTTVTKGYDYFLDVWEGVCRGPVEIIDIYKQDKLLDSPVGCSGEYVNDGTGSYYPAEMGEFSSAIPGVMHIFWKQLALGLNATNVSTYHFVTQDLFETPIDYENLATGKNPAALIWHLLTDRGARPEQMDLESFNTAADIWREKGFGLNISFSKRQKLRSQVKTVLGYAGGRFVEDFSASGVVYRLYAQADDTPEASLVSDDFLDFQFVRDAPDRLPNYFLGKYVDEDQDFSERTIPTYNPALIRLFGRIEKSIDLTAFRNREAACRRLQEIMREKSFPAAKLQFTTTFKFFDLTPGKTITVSEDSHGIESAEFFITHKEVNLEKQIIKWQAEQITTTLFDDHFFDPLPAIGWVDPDYSPIALTKTRIFELPRNPLTDDDPALLILAAREILIEDGLAVQMSATGEDYTLAKTVTSWSQAGTLDEAYSADTYEIDDGAGILYTPYNEDPIFHSVSRTDLFRAKRVAIIGDEIFAFQNVTLEGESSIRLTGIIRGLFNTPVQSHAAGATIWITPVGNAYFTGFTGNDFYLKLLPRSGAEQLDPAEASAHHIIINQKAGTPWPVGRIEAVRTGDNVAVTWWPVDVDPPGAGVLNADHPDQWPFVFRGDFQYKVGSGDWTAISATTLNINQSGSFSLSVRARQNGLVSTHKTLSVGAADGTYIA